MKAHISKDQTQMFNKIREKIENVRRAGLAAGCKGMAGAIYDKATDEKLSIEARLEEIKRLCQVGLNINSSDAQSTIAYNLPESENRGEKEG